MAIWIYETLLRVAGPVLGDLWRLLISSPAQHVYVVATSAAVLGAALWGAYVQKNELDGITEDFFVIKFPGRVPITARGWRRRQKKINQKRAEKLRELWSRIGALFALGVLLPSVFLYFGTVFYWWFDAATPLRDAGGPVASPQPLDLLVYVLDQLLRGGFFDALEVFNIPVAKLSHDPGVYYYSTGLLAFRLYAQAFFIFGFMYLGRTAWLLVRVFVIKPQKARPVIRATPRPA